MILARTETFSRDLAIYRRPIAQEEYPQITQITQISN